MLRKTPFHRSFASLSQTVNKLDLKMSQAPFPEIDKSFMKVLDGEIDKDSDAYKQNYDLMMEKNEELDRITQEQMFVNAKYT